MPRGSIRKRTTTSGSSYQVRFCLGPDPVTGKQREWSQTYHTRREAERALAQQAVALEQGTAVMPSRLTLAEALDAWLHEVEHTARPKTLEDYRRTVVLHILPFIGSVPLQRLTPSMVQDLYGSLLAQGRGVRTVEQVHQRLGTACERAVRLGLVSQNVVRRAVPPRVERAEREVWTPEQARCFLRATQGSAYGPIWLVFLTTGMRRGEVLGLRWSDVDWERGSLRVQQSAVMVHNAPVAGPTKTRSSRRTVSVPPEVLEALRGHRTAQLERKVWLGPAWQEHDLVFPNDIGGYILGGNLRRQFLRLVKAAGVPTVRIHDLRHQHVATLLQSGADVKEVAERVGHSRTSVTLDIYHHVAQSQRDASMERIRAAYFGNEEE